MDTSQKVKAGHMMDGSGNWVPVKWVPKYDKLRDREVRRMVKAFDAERARLEGLMDKVLATVQKLKKARGTGIAEKGNIMFSSFDNLARVEIVTRYRIELDDRAMLAKKMMLDYVNECLADVKNGDERVAVMQIITDAFTPNRGGCLRANMVVRVLNYKIRAKAWRAACDVLRDAMSTSRSKSYVNVSTRESQQSDWSVIKLDIADCWPEGFVVE